MRIRYTVTNGRLEFGSDVSTTKEAFEWLSTIQEIFEEETCGLCGGNHLHYDVREYDGNNYYKLACRDCGGTLDFGQRRDGSNLFIKRKDAEGNTLPNRGWYRYQPGESPRATQQQPARPSAPAQSPRRTTPAQQPQRTAPRPDRRPAPRAEVADQPVPF